MQSTTTVGGPAMILLCVCVWGCCRILKGLSSGFRPETRACSFAGGGGLFCVQMSTGGRTFTMFLGVVLGLCCVYAANSVICGTYDTNMGAKFDLTELTRWAYALKFNALFDCTFAG